MVPSSPKARGLALIAVLIVALIGFFAVKYSAGNKLAKALENRVLVIVMENNFGVPEELSSLYDENKENIDAILAFVFKTEKENMAGMGLAEVIDAYGEDYLADRFKKAAKGYGEVVVLTDGQASYGNFEETLVSLNEKGKTVDILLDLHGGPDEICFYEDCVDNDWMEFMVSMRSSEPLNIGFVYQTLCYGGQNMEPWLKMGAKAANGAEGLNNFVVIAPEKFLRSWTNGDGFAEAVEKGYSLELSVDKIMSKIFPGYSLTEESVNSGRMLFLGNKNYSL